MADETVEVLIVGGSMVGLSTALFLAQQGVRPVLVERHQHLSAHPRAQAVSPRTMELMRALGLEDEVRANENPHAQYGDILQAESLAGRELGRFRGPFRHDPSEVAATGWTLIGQDKFEPVLRARAEALGADLRFATELVSFSQDDSGVDAILRNVSDGTERSVRARYLVATDGFRSPIRERLGIGVHGPGVFGRQMNIVFHADLDAHVAGRTFFLCFVSNAQVKGVLGKLGGERSDRWVLAPSLPPEDSHQEYDTQACVDLVRAATGVPGLAVTVESSTSWEIGAWVADRFRSGRVLLAGDCAHVMPPTGGFGGNMGVQDAHNLAWKLSLVLRGQAGPGLLDSYEQERAPVAEFTVDQGVIRYLQRSGLDEEAAARHQPETTVLFGHVYRSGAVVGETCMDDASPVEDPALPSGRPGTRAPHLPLGKAEGGEGTPLHDLLDGGFLLMAGPGGSAWGPALAEVRTATGLAVAFHRIGIAEPSEVSERFAKAYGVGEEGAVLIRPDGFIAWRTSEGPLSAGAELSSVLDRILCRAG
ncbi:FAD-dependent monooxygenase [Streptomyces hyaluromycini]|uniref:FAD-dependent monooxygenase n=1 Tax=Streptomyces hyaluromycini TaxID=1377993 RepID=UPI00142E607C|nr:FAD-dependent monooxygenase [Streptomyces hyaluromycini]